MQGSPNFVIRQSLASPDTVNGTIVLAKELDFEKQSMYTLTVFAMVSVRDYTGLKLCSLPTTYINVTLPYLSQRNLIVKTETQREVKIAETVHNYWNVGQK